MYTVSLNLCGNMTVCMVDKSLIINLMFRVLNEYDNNNNNNICVIIFDVLLRKYYSNVKKKKHLIPVIINFQSNRRALVSKYKLCNKYKIMRDLPRKR